MIKRGKEIYKRYMAIKAQVDQDAARGVSIYYHTQKLEAATMTWLDFCFWNKNLAKEIEEGLI